jgi:hypothetical protein
MSKQLAHTLYGEPVKGIRPAAAQTGSRLAAASAPDVGRNRCIANEDTCEGPKSKGTDYCIGHLRSMAKKNAQEVTDEHER